MDKNVRDSILHLSLIPNVGPRTVKALLNAFSDNLEALYAMTAQDISERAVITRMIAEKVVSGLADSALLRTEKILIEQHGVSIVTLFDDDYPLLLSHIYAPPPVLYYKGSSLSMLARALAFVGSRKADAYGQQVVNNLIPEVVNHSFTTVSGGALGIDGMVHRATLKSHGQTAIILGSGLLRPYPAVHKELFKEVIEQGGLVMSAFPLLTDPIPQNFPARNRIIAGLCQATLVIQAARKSGALLTARHALDEGRDVGAVPGSIFNEVSAGCHELIAQGARPIFSAADIFAMINYSMISVPGSSQSLKLEEKRADDPILAWCAVPKTWDDIAALSGYTYDVLQERLWRLQLAGHIDQNMLGMWYCRD